MQVTTPSGNVTYNFKGTSFTSVGYGGYLSQTTVESNEKMLFKAGQVHNDRSSTTVNIVSSSTGQCAAYTVEYDYGFANGNVMQSNQTFSAAPC